MLAACHRDRATKPTQEPNRAPDSARPSALLVPFPCNPRHLRPLWPAVHPLKRLHSQLSLHHALKTFGLRGVWHESRTKTLPTPARSLALLVPSAPKYTVRLYLEYLHLPTLPSLKFSSLRSPSSRGSRWPTDLFFFSLLPFLSSLHPTYLVFLLCLVFCTVLPQALGNVADTTHRHRKP